MSAPSTRVLIDLTTACDADHVDEEVDGGAKAPSSNSGNAFGESRISHEAPAVGACRWDDLDIEVAVALGSDVGEDCSMDCVADFDNSQG